MQNHYSHAAPVFAVSDVSESVAFYRDILGFEVQFLWEDPATYGVLKANESISLHISHHPTIPTGPKLGLYVFVNRIDEFYQKIIDRGGKIHNPIGNRDYEMRDFDVLDPDGYMITFGCGLELIDQAS